MCRRRLSAAALTLTFAAACQPLPQPLAGARSDAGLLRPPVRADIVVQAIADAPPRTAAALSAAMVGALARAGVAARTGSGGAGSAFLLGQVVDPGRDARILWELFAADGTGIGTHEQPIEGTPVAAWAAGDAVLMERLARGASVAVAAMLRSGDAREAALPAVHVAAVTGAPGDGDRALPRAVSAALAAAGLAVAAVPEEAAAVLSGTVASRRLPGRGEMAITLTWTLRDERGIRIGAISQSDTVAAGSLDGAWGPVAAEIAGHVAAGVADLLAEARRRRAGRTPPGGGARKRSRRRVRRRGIGPGPVGMRPGGRSMGFPGLPAAARGRTGCRAGAGPALSGGRRHRARGVMFRTGAS